MSDGASGELRVGVVGCGFQGRLHVECLNRIPGVAVIAVCDRDPARAAALAADHGIPATYERHAEMLERHELDLVTVCTMPDTHREIVVDALEAGAHVLCEKPLAFDLDDGRAMVAAADRTRRTLSVGFNLRYTTAAQAVRAFIDDGRLGQPVCARGSMLETEIPWWGPHHVKELSGGGAIAATAVHMLDLLMWLAGNPAPLTATASMTRLFPRKRAHGVPSAEAAAHYDVEDLAFGHVRFENGFWLSLEGAWVWDEPGSECRFTLVGDGAQASAEPLHFWAERQGELVDITGDATGDLDFPSSVQRELEDVVARVREGRPPLASGEQALQVQAVIDALYRSADAGRDVTVESLAGLDRHADRR
jgi:predicted dehydrogenase